MRKYGLGWSLPLIISVIGVMVELKGHVPEHYENMLNLWWLFAISGVLFLITLILLFKKENYGLAVFLMVAQFGFAFLAMVFHIIRIYCIRIYRSMIALQMKQWR